MEAGELSPARKEEAPITKPKAGAAPLHNRKFFIGALAIAALLFVCIFTPLYIKGKNDNDSAAASGEDTSPSNNGGSTTERQYLTRDGPLGYNISLFGPDVVKGYENADDLANDIENVARFLVSSTMDSADTAYAHDRGQGEGGAGGADSLTADAPAVGNSATDYEGNNQVKGIDQGDYIVSDGTHGKNHLCV
jgi:hypothetical protein